jgi:hypothetical protein
VQSNAVGKVYTNGPNLPETELTILPNTTTLNTLTLPPGVYLITATVNFQNRANNVFADNTRMLKCMFVNEFIWLDRLGAPANGNDWSMVTMHTVRVQTGTGPVSLSCGAIDGGQAFAMARRLTAVRVGDSPN